MATLSGFTRPAGVVGPDFASKLAAATGLVIDSASVDQTDAYVTGPTLAAGNKAALQTAMNTYTNDPTFGLIIQPTIFTINGCAPLVWTNMPAALTAAAGTLTRLPLHNARYARLTCHVMVVGSAGSILIAQVSLDGAAWTSGPQVPVTATGLQVSGLTAIPAQFQTDVFFRIAGQGGNAVADPQFGLTTVQIA